ncbi:MAG: hypothetical protein RL026_1125 [Pseudomonadota bacterium]|jgi:hypothetical protein
MNAAIMKYRARGSTDAAAPSLKRTTDDRSSGTAIDLLSSTQTVRILETGERFERRGELVLVVDDELQQPQLAPELLRRLAHPRLPTHLQSVARVSRPVAGLGWVAATSLVAWATVLLTAGLD